MNKNFRVVVAMSGGVDSSVAAALLVEQGLDVSGIILKLWHGDLDRKASEERFLESCDQARQVANQFGIRFDVVDAAEIFQQQIVNYFIQSLHDGRTPNPCFVCNQKIKWGLLMDEATKQGADYLATGHYARIIRMKSGLTELRQAVDLKKDQSYVLAGLNQKQLSRAILPLGEKSKPEVRDIARSYNFNNYNKQDSQDLCFFGSMDQETFIETYAPQGIKNGEIINLAGEVIGTHNGLVNYTIGQRKGLGAGFKEPIFVLGKDVARNILIAGTRNDLGIKKMLLNDVTWSCGDEPKLPMDCGVKIRYKAGVVDASVNKINNKYFVVFKEKVRDATPGQFAVFYDDDLVVGSGEIQQIFGENL